MAATKVQLTGAEQVQGVLPVADGGTGTTTLTGIVKGNGTSALSTVASLSATIPVWYEIHCTYVQRTVGYGTNTMGVMAPDTFTLTGVIYRGVTADATSGTFELRKNTTQISGTSLTIPAANQWPASSADTTNLAACTVSGLSVSIAAGDILQPYISAISGTAGTGFAAIVIGTKTVSAA